VITVSRRGAGARSVLSEETPLDWQGQNLFPRMVQPRVFALLWLLLLGLTAGLAVIGVMYLHLIGA
jgi:hypothetical protein